MATEYREIKFTQAELIEALEGFCKATAPDTPAVRPAGIKFTNTSDSFVSVRCGDNDRTFSAAEVTAALIRFARKVCIPIARGARKAVGADHGGIVLKLWIE
ncbi:MAG: hypothetical protein ACE5ED_05845 [Rhodothalassiaceae bacterium]